MGVFKALCWHEDPLGLVAMMSLPGQDRGWLFSWVLALAPWWVCPALLLACPVSPSHIILSPVFPPSCGFGVLAWMLLASLWGALVTLAPPEHHQDLQLLGTTDNKA